MQSPAAYIKDMTEDKSAVTLLVYFLLIIAGLLYVYVEKDWKIPLAAVIVLPPLLFHVWKTEIMLGLLLLYTGVLPDAFAAKDYAFFKFYYYIQIGVALLVVIYILHWMNSTVSRFHSIPLPRVNSKEKLFDSTGLAVQILLVWVIFLGFRGLALGHKPYVVTREWIYFFLYTSYFFWLYLFRSRKEPEKWIKWTMIVAVATAIEYLIFVASSFQDIIKFVMERLVTRQGHITLISAPFAAAYFFLAKSFKKRIFWAGILFLVIIQVFFTQQRVLWLALALTSFVFYTLLVFKDGITFRKTGLWLVGILTVILLFVLLFIAMGYFLQTDLSTLFKRWEDVKSLGDASLQMRIFDLKRGWQYFKMEPILGHGLGAKLLVTPMARLFHFFDNTYGVTLFKGGVPFLALILWTYLSGLWKAWMLFTKTKDPKIKIIAIGLFSAVFAIMATAMVNVSMLYYRFIFVWMMILALVTYYYEREFSEPQPASDGE